MAIVQMLDSGYRKVRLHVMTLYLRIEKPTRLVERSKVV